MPVSDPSEVQQRPASPRPVRGASALARTRWRRALVAYRSADAAFWPVRARFDAAERLYFAQRSMISDMSGEEDAALRGRTGLTQAEAEEGAYGNAMHRAARALYHTPAPDLQALICKTELLLAVGYDGPSEEIILADLRRFSRRRRS